MATFRPVIHGTNESCVIKASAVCHHCKRKMVDGVVLNQESTMFYHVENRTVIECPDCGSHIVFNWNDFTYWTWK